MPIRIIKNMPPQADSMRGFSLMEFLVASALGMIVMVAATSGYFTARNLNKVASARVEVQQDVRQAANLLARDARMAGSFGCFNMASATNSAVLADNAADQAQALESTGVSRLQPVKVLGNGGGASSEQPIDFDAPVEGVAAPLTNVFHVDGFASSGSVAVFQYGENIGTLQSLDASLSANNPIVYSSCRAIVRPSETLKTAAAVREALGVADTVSDGDISVLRYTPAAYAVGSLGGQQGLFRFSLNAAGQWSQPQLLVKNISSWSLSYLYVEDCPEPASAASATEHFIYSNTADSENTPALIRIQFNNGTLTAADDNVVSLPAIEVSLKGGNTCADRSL